MGEKKYDDLEKSGAIIQIFNTSRFFISFSAIGSLIVISFVIISGAVTSTAIMYLIFMWTTSILALLFRKFRRRDIALGLFLISALFLFSVSYSLLVQIISLAKNKDFVGIIFTATGIGNVLLAFLAISLFVSSILSIKAASKLGKLRDIEVIKINDEHDLMNDKSNKNWFILGFQTIAILILTTIHVVPSTKEKLLKMNIPYNEKAFFEVINQGDIDAIKLFLKAGMNINTRRANDTALIYAIVSNQEGVAKLLIEKGADVNARGKEERTPLIVASTKGSMELASLLLEKGASINAETRYGNTALIEASIKGSMELASLLLEKGASINAENLYGRTALIEASTQANVELVKFLIAKGADVNARSDDGTTALIAASTHRNLELVEALLEQKPDLNASSNLGTPLTLAAAFNHAENVKILIKAGVDINSTSNTGTTALMSAAASGNIDMVKFLIRNGADINMKNRYGHTALKLASMARKGDVVKLLKQSGARM